MDIQRKREKLYIPYSQLNWGRSGIITTLPPCTRQVFYILKVLKFNLSAFISAFDVTLGVFDVTLGVFALYPITLYLYHRYNESATTQWVVSDSQWIFTESATTQ